MLASAQLGSRLRSAESKTPAASLTRLLAREPWPGTLLVPADAGVDLVAHASLRGTPGSIRRCKAESVWGRIG